MVWDWDEASLVGEPPVPLASSSFYLLESSYVWRCYLLFFPEEPGGFRQFLSLGCLHRFSSWKWLRFFGHPLASRWLIGNVQGGLQ